MIERGRLYWVSLDKRRPALVVSNDVLNTRTRYAHVVPCSTNARELSTHVVLSKGEGGLTARSALKCELLQLVGKDAIDPDPLGPPLSMQRMNEVGAALRLVLDLFDL